MMFEGDIILLIVSAFVSIFGLLFISTSGTSDYKEFRMLGGLLFILGLIGVIFSSISITNRESLNNDIFQKQVNVLESDIKIHYNNISDIELVTVIESKCELYLDSYPSRCKNELKKRFFNITVLSKRGENNDTN